MHNMNNTRSYRERNYLSGDSRATGALQFLRTCSRHGRHVQHASTTRDTLPIQEVTAYRCHRRPAEFRVLFLPLSPDSFSRLRHGGFGREDALVRGMDRRSDDSSRR